MRTVLTLISALTLTAAAQAQAVDPAQAPAQQPAPIVRSNPYGMPGGMAPGGGYVGRPQGPRQMFDMQPAAGVSVRADMDHGVQTVTASNELTELRLTRGRADVTVHHPANHSQILVDLPGGQVALFKDGFYTFNAATNTVRVLHGEAAAYGPGADPKSKGAKIREDQELTFYPNVKLKAVDAEPYEIAQDVVGGGRMERGEGYDEGYGAGFYGGYPGYAYGYPYGYGLYPYGFGYPIGIGVGFGYYGGGFYRGGGFRGGFRR